MMEDGAETLMREENAQLAARTEKFITNLEHALIRIKNKTYGVCRKTGKLINKDRLRLVPHVLRQKKRKTNFSWQVGYFHFLLCSWYWWLTKL